MLPGGGSTGGRAKPGLEAARLAAGRRSVGQGKAAGGPDVRVAKAAERALTHCRWGPDVALGDFRPLSASLVRCTHFHWLVDLVDGCHPGRVTDTRVPGMMLGEDPVIVSCKALPLGHPWQASLVDNSHLHFDVDAAVQSTCAVVVGEDVTLSCLQRKAAAAQAQRRSGL